MICKINSRGEGSKKNSTVILRTIEWWSYRLLGTLSWSEQSTSTRTTNQIFRYLTNFENRWTMSMGRGGAAIQLRPSTVHHTRVTQIGEKDKIRRPHLNGSNAYVARLRKFVISTSTPLKVVTDATLSNMGIACVIQPLWISRTCELLVQNLAVNRWSFEFAPSVSLLFISNHFYKETSGNWVAARSSLCHQRSTPTL
jgi:hypothetical protein